MTQGANETRPMGMVTVAYDLGNGRTVSVGFNTFDKVLDEHRLVEVIDTLERQRTRLEIPFLELELEQRQYAVENMEAELEILRADAPANGKGESQNIRALLSNIVQGRKDIAAGQRALNEARKKARAFDAGVQEQTLQRPLQ